MRVPEVTERMKEAPAHALRAVFAGIGQVLLVADRLKNRPGGEPGEPATAAPAGAAARAGAGSADAWATAADDPLTGAAPAGSATARPAPAATATASPTASSPAPARPAPGPAAASVTATSPVPDRAATAQASAAGASAAAGATPEAAGLPLAGYDDLSVASLRARMRSLDVAGLRELVGYEKNHASGRPCWPCSSAVSPSLRTAGPDRPRVPVSWRLLSCRWRALPSRRSPSARCCGWSASGSDVSAGSGSRDRLPS